MRERRTHKPSRDVRGSGLRTGGTEGEDCDRAAFFSPLLSSYSSCLMAMSLCLLSVLSFLLPIGTK